MLFGKQTKNKKKWKIKQRNSIKKYAFLFPSVVSNIKFNFIQRNNNNNNKSANKWFHMNLWLLHFMIQDVYYYSRNRKKKKRKIIINDFHLRTTYHTNSDRRFVFAESTTNNERKKTKINEKYKTSREKENKNNVWKYINAVRHKKLPYTPVLSVVQSLK